MVVESIGLYIHLPYPPCNIVFWVSRLIQFNKLYILYWISTWILRVHCNTAMVTFSIKYIRKRKTHRKSISFLFAKCELWLLPFFHLIDISESVYSSALTADSQTYSRVCGKTNYYYETIQVNAVTAGSYSLSSSSTIDTYGHLYKDNFNPTNPSENSLAWNDDENRCRRQFKLLTYLQANITYVLVVTTFSPNVQGNFLVHVTGPNNISLNSISLNRTSEYFYFLVNK